MKPINERARPWKEDNFPPGWHRTKDVMKMPGVVELRTWINGTHSIFVSEEIHNDGKLWAHASIAKRKGNIRYEDLLYLRRHWLSHDWPATQFFPAAEGYVNIHENCLHLWVSLEEDPAWVEETVA